MIRVAITGGLGSGKSTVLEILSKKGAIALSADDIAKEMISPGGPAYNPVARRFPDALKADQSIDPARLAAKVFTDARSLAWLNGLVHPLVAHKLRDMMDQMQKDGIRAVAVEVPLLVEAGMTDMFDVVIAVNAPVEERVERMVAAGWKDAPVRRRIENQISDEERSAAAGEVIENVGTLQQLRGKVDRLWKRLTQAAK